MARARPHAGLNVAHWAVLGANRLKAVALPPEVERLWIFADAGKVGIEQAIKAADYFEYTRGIRVEIEAPEFGDWNDAVRRAA